VFIREFQKNVTKYVKGWRRFEEIIFQNWYAIVFPGIGCATMSNSHGKSLFLMPIWARKAGVSGPILALKDGHTTGVFGALILIPVKQACNARSGSP
jgi:hypothetical protein